MKVIKNYKLWIILSVSFLLMFVAVVENHIMLQKNIYSTIASRLGIRTEDAHIRFSTDYSIEKSIAILMKILDNNGIEYDKEEIESSGFIKQRSETVNRQLCV